MPTVKVPRFITADWLRSLGACSTQVQRFRRLFPDGCRFNQKNAARAGAAGMTIWWFRLKVMSDSEEARFLAACRPSDRRHDERVEANPSQRSFRRSIRIMHSEQAVEVARIINARARRPKAAKAA
ncbi:MAG: hypothetical protein JWO31_2084 [Phycisphaerales bacterium]|nr:hypothetical protein [Phycisphaerales bacterium]